MSKSRCVHFVGFRGDEIHSARRVWGEADFYHRTWDTRARREIAPGDVVVHAKGEWTKPPAEFTSSDTVSCDAQRAFDSK